MQAHVLRQATLRRGGAGSAEDLRTRPRQRLTQGAGRATVQEQRAVTATLAARVVAWRCNHNGRGIRRDGDGDAGIARARRCQRRHMPPPPAGAAVPARVIGGVGSGLRQLGKDEGATGNAAGDGQDRTRCADD